MRQTPAEAVSSPVVQRSLQISQPGDRWEREADEMADEIMRRPEPALAGTRSWGHMQRCPDGSCGPEDEKEVMRVADGSTSSGDTSVSAMASLGNGRPMTSGERSFFEPRFNRDFSRVRIHHTPESVEAAKSIKALAFTYRHHIGLGAKANPPGSPTGKRLLAHELTHVVQQGAAARIGEDRQ